MEVQSMDYNRLIKEFSSLCKERGFSKKGKAFSRCIGDGIYQNITIAEKYYIDPSSPEYSSTNRKSPSIRFGFWSMYSDLSPAPDFFTVIFREHGWGLFPENILGIKSEPFMGYTRQHEIMLDKGFDLLDSITTQKQLLSVTYQLLKAEWGEYIPHLPHLAAPHALCNEILKARDRIYSIYVQNCLTFFEKTKPLKDAAQYEEYFKKLDEFEDSTKDLTTFLYLTFKEADERNEYMRSCLERNIQYAKENKIAFADNFEPLLKK